MLVFIARRGRIFSKGCTASMTLPDRMKQRMNNNNETPFFFFN